MKAPEILEKAAQHMRDRAATYDKPEGERSMAQAVDVFNLFHGTNLTEAQGWHFMQVLKDVRLFARDVYHADSAEDCTAYSALKAEALALKIKVDIARFKARQTVNGEPFDAAAHEDEAKQEPVWIEWTGDEFRPVSPSDIVEYRLRGFEKIYEAKAVSLNWDHEDSPCDIVAYRVIKKAEVTK